MPTLSIEEYKAQTEYERILTDAALRDYAQTPSRHIVKEYSKTLGDIASTYAAPFLGEPDDWQKLLLRDILALDDDGKFLHKTCGYCASRQNGKSWSAEARALFGAAVLKERVLWTAHLVSTSADVFTRMVALIRSTPKLQALVSRIREANGQQEIRFKNSGHIKFMTRTKNQARGQTFDLLIIDEAQELSQPYWEALSAVTTASENGQTILLGTPPNSVSQGDFFEDYRARLLGKKPDGQYWAEWSATKRDDDSHLDDVFEWAKANPAIGERITVETLEQSRNSSASDSFARERLSMFGTTTVGSVVPEDVFRALVDPDSIPLKKLSLAIDLNNSRERASISVAGINEHGVPHVEVIRQDAGTDWIVDYVVSVLSRHEFDAVVIDKRSPAISLLDDFKNAGIRITQTETADMLTACGKFYDRCMTGDLAHNGQDQLALSLMSATKRKVGEAWALAPRKPDSDITPIVSAVLALWGTTTTKTKVRPQRTKKERVKRPSLMNHL